MNEKKFTDGPWHNVKKQDYYNLGLTEHYYDVYHIINAKGEIIAKLTAEGMGKDKNIKANVSLITAAPKLYKKLHDILAQQCGECCSTVDVGDIRGKTPCEKGETCPYGMDDVEALLAEARGEKMSETKFTPGPWEKRRKTIGDFTGISIFGENCPIGLIAKLPFRNEFALIREYKEKFSQEEVDANAALIAAAPEMYDNEKSNMALLKVLREFIQSMMQEPHFIPLLDSLTTFIDKIDERMVASEQTLKKARGEE